MGVIKIMLGKVITFNLVDEASHGSKGYFANNENDYFKPQI